jgi:hypothetical protein
MQCKRRRGNLSVGRSRVDVFVQTSSRLLLKDSFTVHKNYLDMLQTQWQGIKCEVFMSDGNKHGYQVQVHIGIRAWKSVHHPTWYVADLPRHDGLTPVSGSKSDWGFTDKRERAIPLTPYWQRRWRAHCERDHKRPWGFLEVTP